MASFTSLHIGQSTYDMVRVVAIVVVQPVLVSQTDPTMIIIITKQLNNRNITLFFYDYLTMTRSILNHCGQCSQLNTINICCPKSLAMENLYMTYSAELVVSEG